MARCAPRGTITGTGSLIKDGSGTLDLADATLPDALAYTVTKGTLILSATASGSLTVTEGEIVIGNGTAVAGAIVVSSGAAAPAPSPVHLPLPMVQRLMLRLVL